MRQTLSRWAGGDGPASGRRLPFLLFIAALLAYGSGFAATRLANFDVLDLVVTTQDDAFYYFQIAWNMAQGRFSTFDGGITQTNGYHPLWLFLITPFYWFMDKESALFAIRALEIMLIAGGVAVIAGAAKLCRLPWLLLFAALPLLYRHEVLFFGMEAAAALFMLALLFVGLALFIGNPGRWKWGLAAICFALPWVRLEYIAISLAVAGVLCLFEFPQWRRAAGGGGWRDRLRAYKALAPLAGAGAGVGVYFAYNGLVFGGLVPVSGATKAAWSQSRWDQAGGYDFAANFADVLRLPAFDGEVWAALEICLWLLPVWWLARRPGPPAENGRDRRLFAFMLGGFGLAAGHLAMFGYTVLVVPPNFHDGAQWYFVPAYLLMALLIPLRCYAVLGLLGCWVGPRWPRAVRPLQAAAVIAAVGGLLWQADFAYPREQHDYGPGRPNARVMRYAGALTANRGLPEGSVIGAWDAGGLAYFSRFPVVNLDGLVNSYDYRRLVQPEEDPPPWAIGGGIPPPMVREFGLTHLSNTGSTIWDDDLYERRWLSADGDVGYRFKIRPVATEGVAAAAADFGERLAITAGRPEGGVSFTVTADGRRAQAFAADCAPEELLVWTYAGGGAAPATYPALTTYRSAAGWCSAELAAAAGVPRPSGAELRPVGDYLAQQGGFRRPDDPAGFGVYLINGLSSGLSSGPPGGATPQLLLYARKECRPADLEPWFFLHLFPADPAGLEAERQPYGFVNADFRFKGEAARFGGWCLLARPLPPDYPVSRLRTGQWLPEESRRLWEAEIPLVPGRMGP